MSITGGDQSYKIDLGSVFMVPGVLGVWDMPFEEGIVGVHAALLHTNQVLFWTYRDDLGDHDHDVLRGDDGEPILDKKGNKIFIVVQNGEWSLLSLSSRKHIIKKEISQRNQFCAGQCLLGDGSVLVVGGERDTPDNDRTVRLYHPTSRVWKDLPDLLAGRYYPTVVSLARKFGFIFGGSELTAGVAHYRHDTALLLDTEAEKAVLLKDFDSDLKALPDYEPPPDTPPVIYPFSYPFVFILPYGGVLVHVGYKTRILKFWEGFDFASATKLDANDTTSRNYPYQGTAVLLPLRPTDTPPYRARIMLIGGGAPNQGTAKDSCEILDLGLPNPQWQPANKMGNPRIMPDAVLLPDGNVLVVNGGRSGGLNSKQPVFEAEVYNPISGHWTTLAPMTINRLYHATALLLPDAKVLSAGTDRQWNALPDPNAKFKGYDYAHTELEVFSPPYLFWGPRPTIHQSPESVSYGATFDVATDDAQVKSAVLIRNGSCTHSFNSDQRFVELEIKKRYTRGRWWIKWVTVKEGRFGARWGRGFVRRFQFPVPFHSKGLLLQAPPNFFVAPEGYYMLFLVSNAGVPSEATFVRVGQE